MKPVFDPSILKRIIAILLLLILVKLLWFVVEVAFFPAQGINHAEEKRAKPLYYRIRLTPNEAQPPRKETPAKPVGSIRDITLLGVYSDSDVTVVTIRYQGKSKVLGKGDSVNGFTLDRAGHDYAIFTKEGKEYKVELQHSKTAKSNAIRTIGHPSVPKASSSVPQGEIVDAGDRKIIDHGLVEYFGKHMGEIEKNIGIREVKKNGGIEGFRVTFVKRGSPFAKLGLRRGDILKSVNGEALTSYKVAFDIYKQVGEMQNMTLVIKRGNKEMELEYEVN